MAVRATVGPCSDRDALLAKVIYSRQFVRNKFYAVSQIVGLPAQKPPWRIFGSAVGIL